jgi:hypothetical protein
VQNERGVVGVVLDEKGSEGHPVNRHAAEPR